MKANPLKFSIICLKVIFFTAKISLITLYKSYRHTFTRENGNQLMQYWSDKMLKLVNLHLIIHPNNEPLNTENRACIYMSNHLSLFDIPVLYKAIPGTLRMVAKKELFNTPIWGQGMKAGEFIMLDRQNSKQSITALKLARKK
ncbi:MAG: 1-acyl-sn-glycerol-3-phosphate acyltransferase, partial [Methylococcales bacterium]|nr:1-acyl-sn-glycerol-3-phosphate acyltransferase [Methylococcales bacterium]